MESLPGLRRTSTLILTRLISDGADYPHYWWGLTLIGAGAGLIFPAIGTAVVGTFSPDKTGLVSGINDMSREVGSALGIAVAGAIFAPVFRSQFGDFVASLGLPADQAARITAGGARGAGPPLGLPPGVSQALESSIRHAYSAGLVDILYVSAAVLAVGAVASFALARRRHMWEAVPETASYDLEAKGTADSLVPVED